MIRTFAKAYLFFLRHLVSFTLGWLSCVAWVLTIRFAPEIAVDLIARVS